MKKIFNAWKIWLSFHPKFKQWYWFIVLWCSGLLAVLLLAYPIKLLIKHYM